MNLEGFSKKGMELGDSPEQINKEHQNNLREQYLNTVKKLALQKMKNDLMFEGLLGASIRRLSSIGLDISRESILKDVQHEIIKQRSLSDFVDVETNDFSTNLTDSVYKMDSSVLEKNQQYVNQLKNNIVDAPKEQQEVSIIQNSIPRESVIQGHNEHQEEIPELENAKEAISQKLDWAMQQPNEPTIVKGEKNIQSSIWDDLNGLDKKSGEYSKKFETIYEIQVERLALLKINNNPNFNSQLDLAVQNILKSTDRIPNAREQLLYDIDFYISHSYSNIKNNTNERDNIINDIIQKMYPEGGEYVPINDVKKQLESYSMEQLEELKSQYLAQIQEQQTHMHR